VCRVDKENETVKQSTPGFRSTSDELMIGTSDSDNWKKPQILPDVDI
jgi:hypothetical protein